MIFPLTALWIAFLISLSTPAFAYLDPSTGSMLLQAIVGALAVGGAVIGGFWHKIRSFFQRSKSEKSKKNSR